MTDLLSEPLISTERNPIEKRTTDLYYKLRE